MTVSVELVGGVKKDALVLPSGAVRDADREAPWALALQDGLAVRVPLKLGLRGVGAVEILSGLKEGDAVIPQTEKALPGDRVRRGPTVAPEFESGVGSGDGAVAVEGVQSATLRFGIGGWVTY